MGDAFASRRSRAIMSFFVLGNSCGMIRVIGLAIISLS
jgi:hypothetical protein